MKQTLFTGSAVAIVTPFSNESVDYEALGRLLQFQLSSGTDAVVVCGTTGEAATLSYAERMAVIQYVVDQVNGRVPVIAGSGANNTETAITLSRDAAQSGVDGLLVVTPYYNKATQTGLLRHFTAVADSVEKPVILYNVPSRTGVSIAAETYEKLSRHPRIVGVKEASGNFSLLQRTRRLCAEDFSIWSGNDEDTAAVCLLGGKGVISVAANVVPAEMHALVDACLKNDFRKAGELQLKLHRLCELLFCEVNPIPVKTALAMMGYCSGTLRLPLCEMSPENRLALQEGLQTYGLI